MGSLPRVRRWARGLYGLWVFLLLAGGGCSFVPGIRGEGIVLEEYRQYAPTYDPALYPPKTLLFSEIDPDYLRKTARFWRRVVGMDGFILRGIAAWGDDPDAIGSKAAGLTAVNRACARHGIDRNFIKVSLGHGTLPVWSDEPAWSGIVALFGEAAGLAFATGCRGILIDTEPYTVPLWDPQAPRFEGRPPDGQRDRVSETGAAIMEAMVAAFPGIEVIVIPDGAYRWFAKGGRHYALWIDFFNGLASVKAPGGVIVGVESSYRATDPQSLFRLYHTLDSIMIRECEDPVYWQMRCGIALGFCVA